jgi:hypothetical protein
VKRQPDWPPLLLLSAILLGGLVRLMPAIMTSFPINDGGMFYTMAGELSLNGYALPALTSYNGLNLPFAYPPLGIYLASLLSDFGRIPALTVFLWLPALLSILAIPVFHLFARAVLQDDLHAALATLFFALTPGRYDWHVMGGGVTRAAGMVFLLLASYYVFCLFKEEKLKLIPPAIFFCSLAVLSHPEVGLQTAGLCAVLWLFLGRTRRGVLGAILVVPGVILLTAPWWATVISRNGLTPFLSALQTGGHATVEWLPTLTGLFTTSEFIPILLLLRVAGFVYAILKKRWLFISLVIIPVLVDPRSAASIAYLALSMLAAFGVLDAIPALLKLIKGIRENLILKQRVGVALLFAIALVLFVECGLSNFRLINTTLTVDERETMAWLQENLPPGEDFLIITGHTYSMSDPVQEWFPALSGQHSQTTLQGLEWTLGAGFEARLNDLAGLQACTSLNCLESFKERTGLTYSYLWLNRLSHRDPESMNLGLILSSILASNRFQQIYVSDSVFIFKLVGE